MGKVLGVHGFNFDPDDGCNDPWKLYHDWSRMLLDVVQGFAWYSSTPTVKRRREGLAARLPPIATPTPTTSSRSPRPSSSPSRSSRRRNPVRSSAIRWARACAAGAHQLPAGKVERILILDGAELQGRSAAALTIAAAKIGRAAEDPERLRAS
jgi:hypothetical protein